LNPKTKRVALKLSEPMLSTLAVLFAVAEDPRLAEGEQEELMPFPTELRASDLAHREQELGARLPDDIVARVEGKSTIARAGVAVHVTAGYIDPGFRGTITLELVNQSAHMVSLRPGMPIAQLSFHTLTTRAERP
jgi:dUTPase